MPPRDRAAVVATAVIQITTASSMSERERRLHIEKSLRDEFTDIEREAVAHRGLNGDA